MRVELLFPSRFIKSAEFNGKDVTLTIASVQLVDLESDDGTSKKKGVVGFRETQRGFVLNRTNASALAAMFGKETEQWIGKRVTLFAAPFRDSFTGEQTTAIRVRGSPDIAKDITFDLKLPKKKPTKVRLHATGGKQTPRPDDGPPDDIDASVPREMGEG